MAMINHPSISMPLLNELLSKVSALHLYDHCFELSQFESFGWLPLKGIGLYLTVTLPRIEHEVAHALEISPLRLTKKDLGISNDVSIPNWTNSRFFTALGREIRVRAIQLHLTPKDKINQEQVFCTKIFDHCIWGHQAKMRLPFGRFKKTTELHDWGHELHMRTYRRWNQDKIVHEWDKRIALLNDWIESK